MSTILPDRPPDPHLPLIILLLKRGPLKEPLPPDPPLELCLDPPDLLDLLDLDFSLLS